ncbi:MAG: UDP-N-acetylmuramate dehydrogenase [Candidatus Margulisbacteria bacterium]|nr:UDP-N-acetylmuramate dehydrogenase [Candidatus Margulisiibacteriota bacterium]
MKYLKNEPLRKHTSFRIGGPADYFCTPKNREELAEALKFASVRGLPVAIMGAGTNLLPLDKGWRGLVIRLLGGLDQIKVRGRFVEAGSGVLLPKLLSVLSRKGLGGLEFLAGIPGTLGGALAMNAGAWQKEIGRFVDQVTVMDIKGEISFLKRKELGFKHRASALQKGDLIVIEAKLKLRKSPPKVIKGKIAEFLKQRRDTQPLGIPNAGCVFKNPKDRYAGKLIQDAGCKGLRVGDAQVSLKHANFILNLGEAKAADVIRLMTLVQRRVKVKLEPEIKIMVKSPHAF